MQFLLAVPIAGSCCEIRRTSVPGLHKLTTAWFRRRPNLADPQPFKMQTVPKDAMGAIKMWVAAGLHMLPSLVHTSFGMMIDGADQLYSSRTIPWSE